MNQEEDRRPSKTGGQLLSLLLHVDVSLLDMTHEKIDPNAVLLIE